MDTIRLNKYISDTGYCSRREADKIVEQGRVYINGVKCVQVGTTVATTDRVTIDGKPLKTNKKYIYIALNKPVGITCTTDLKDRTNIIDYIGHKERIFPIGRLDKPSQGLIFLTNDGDIVNKILRAGNSHQKEYVVTVDRPITDDFIRRMGKGVYIDRDTCTLPCKITKESTYVFRIILTQGLNRQIRRMCEVLNYSVTKLCRVRIMNITLKGIAEGKWRYLTSSEMEVINKMCKDSVGTKEASDLSEARKTERPNKMINSSKPRASVNKRGGALSQKRVDKRDKRHSR